MSGLRGFASAALGTALPIGFVMGAAGAGTVRPLPDPGKEAWLEVRFPKIERPTRYESVRVDGRNAVRAESHCGASALALVLDGVDLEETPRLAWDWRIAQGLDIENERTRAGDDFAARVYVTFRKPLEEMTMLERLRRRIARGLYRKPIPGRALTYVWASRAEPEEDWPNPFSSDACMVVRRSGPSDEWQREEVDVAADFRRIFATEPPVPQSLVLMTDTDNTCGRATAYFARFRFVGPREADPEPPRNN